MPFYAEKNMQYAHCAEMCAEMWLYAKYMAVAYSHKNDMSHFDKVLSS